MRNGCYDMKVGSGNCTGKKISNHWLDRIRFKIGRNLSYFLLYHPFKYASHLRDPLCTRFLILLFRLDLCCVGDNTERSETLETGSNIFIGANQRRILEGVKIVLNELAKSVWRWKNSGNNHENCKRRLKVSKVERGY